MWHIIRYQFLIDGNKIIHKKSKQLTWLCNLLRLSYTTTHQNIFAFPVPLLSSLRRSPVITSNTRINVP